MSARSSWRCLTAWFLLLACTPPLLPRADAGELAPEVLERAKAATVLIKTRGFEGERQGSGFFVAKEVVVTNAHVLGMLRPGSPGPTTIVVVLHSGVASKEQRLAARVLGVDRSSDLAFLRVQGARSPAVLSIDPGLKLLETMPVYVFGFPFGTALAEHGNPAVTVQAASVSSVRMDPDQQPREVQIDSNLNPGNSGGPILDAQGRVVGVAVAAIRGTTISFGIPFNYLKNDLAGRALDISSQRVQRSGRTFTIELSLAVLDPLGQLRKVGVRTWAQDRALRTPAPTAQRRATDLVWDARLGRFRGEVVQVVPEGQALWVEAVVVDAEGHARATQASGWFQLEQRAEVTPGARPTTPAPTPAPTPGPASGADAAAPPTARPGSLASVRSTRPRDAMGREYDLVESRIETVTLAGGRLLDLVASPDGAELYACHEGRAEVVVYDPLRLERRAAIPMPRSPTALVCDEEHLVVACPESRAVLVLDRKLRKPLQAMRLPAERGLVLTGVASGGSDHSYLSLWEVPNRYQTVVFAFDARRGARELCTLGSSYVDVDLLSATRLLAWQKDSQLHVFDLRPAPTALPPRASLRLATDCEVDRCRGRALVTHDGLHVAVPGVTHAGAYCSYLAGPELEGAFMKLPGFVIAEVPRDHLLVSWGPAPRSAGAEKTEVYYVGRYSGQVVRRVRVEEDSLVWTRRAAGGPRTCYVPGVERLLYFDPAESRPSVQRIVCGPVQNALLPGPVRVAPVAPPRRAAPGQALRFTPRLEGVPPGAAVAFEMPAGPPGATLDARTGTWCWRPSPLDLGRWAVQISAEVAGTRFAVAKWVLEVEPERP
ncbi:MAG: trypsin-like peptidase domain-containing protein [Planctomycetota bacterium]